MIWETTTGASRRGKCRRLRTIFASCHTNAFSSSDKRYEKLHARYKKYKKRYPDRSPSYYDNRRQWML